MVVLVLLGLFPVAYGLIAWRSRGEARQAKLAYLGYAACALAVGYVQMQVYSSGGVAFMMIGAFLVPIAIAGALAIGNTLGVRSATLRVLGVSTVVVVLSLVVTGFWGVAVALTMALAHAYETLVLLACIDRRREWWPQRVGHSG
jgi:hypothetical protein